MSSKLNKDTVKKFFAKDNNAKAIQNRLGYILDQIYSVLDIKLKNWYVYGAEEGEVGDLRKVIEPGEDEEMYLVNLELTPPIYNKNCWAILDDEEWDLTCNCPVRWLYEDFETELVNGIKAYKEREQRKKEMVKKSKITKKEKESNMIKSILDKVDGTEAKFLKKKLKIK